MLSATALDDQGLAAYGPERPHGTVHAANQHFLGALEYFARTLALALQPGLRSTHVFPFKLTRLQPASDILGVVGKDDFRSGALDAGQNFQDHSLFVQPAILRRSLDHGVLSADIVRTHGNIKRIAHPPDDIQVRQRRLNHHHIRAFFEVELHFLQCFPHVGGIHLITAPVAKLGRGLGRVPERSVEAGTIFRCIRKNGNVLEFVFVQDFANGAHPPIHHVGWGNDVGAGARVRERLLGKNRHGGVICHFTVLDDAAVPMVGVFAEAHVRYDKKFQICLANRFNGALHYAIGTERTGTTCVLGFRQSEKNDPEDPKRPHLTALLHNLIDGLLMDAWHRADFLADLGTRAHEHRVNEARCAQARLSNQAAKRLAPPQTPRPMGGKTHTFFAPAGACFTVPAKCFSSASTTAAAVVSAEITRRLTPASRTAFAVTGQTAVIASLYCRARNSSLPYSSSKC